MVLTDLYEHLNGNSNGLRWDLELIDRIDNPKCIEKYGYKVYSQNDEDGIIDEIFRRIGTVSRKFIEFGVQDGIESNGHYLLMKGWQGLWLECDEVSYQNILVKFKHVIQNQRLTVGKEFITKDNINTIFDKYGMSGEIDLLSIDVDGNDYYVWDEINAVDPRVVVIEYNAKIPPDCEWIMPYYEKHVWDGGDNHSASLASLAGLGNKKGYTLVGTNVSGINAFFVRKDCLGDRFADLPAEKLYNPARYYKKYNSGHPSLYCLTDLPEGRGQEFAGKKDNVILKSGFYGQESPGSQMCWMAGREAASWIAFDGVPEENYEITIQYTNPISGMYSDAAPKYLDLKIEEKTVIQQYLLKSGGTISAVIPENCIREDGVLELVIRVDKTWCPHELEMSDDMRELGIGIQKISIEKADKQ